MPHDGSGKYHMNPQRAKHADAKAMGGAMTEKAAPPAMGEEAEPKTHTLTSNGDGTATTDSGDGQPMQHDSLKAALAQLAEEHGDPELAQQILGEGDGEEENGEQPEEAAMGGGASHGHMLQGY